jgi:phosphoribosylglycinamide formyltransferase-1
MPNITIFASGAGSNAREIIRHFSNHPSVKVVMIVCNKPEAGVLAVAEEAGVPTLLIEKERFFKGDGYVPELRRAETDLIVLAGFLWKIPPAVVEAFPQFIINIHPALLPLYGGKGMYGAHVHESVIKDGQKQSGITIHYVDNEYDHGQKIFQAFCEVEPGDTAETLAAKIHKLEHEHFPVIIEQLLDRQA